MPTLEEIRSIEYPEIQDLGEVTEDDPDDPDSDVPAEPGDDVPADQKGEALAPPVDPESEESPGPKGTPEEAEKEAAPKGYPDPGDDKAKAYDELNSHWANDRVGFVKRFLAGLSPEEQTAVLGAQGASEAEAAPWEPVTPAEEHYARHHKALEALPGFAQGVQREFALRDRYLDDALVTNAALEAKLDAVLQVLDLQLPGLDAAAVRKTLQDGKVGYRDAVRQHYGDALTKAVAAKKQATKPRPKTPGDSGGTQIAVKPGMSMAEIFNRI